MFDSWSDTAVLELATGAHRDIAMATARSLAAVAELLERRIAEELERDLDVKSMITGFERTSAEVGAALNLSAAAARTLVRHADALSTRLPAVGALLAAGQLDWATVEVALTRTELVNDDQMAHLDTVLAQHLTRWSSWSRKSLINALDAEIILADPEAAKKRRHKAYDDRAVRVESGDDGMGWLRARLTATQAAAWDKTLSAMAATACPADPRTLQQRRADAFDALRDGTPFTCTCTDCATRTPKETAPPESNQQPAEQESGGQPAPSPAPDPDPASMPASEQPEPAAPAPAPRSGPQVVLNIIATADTVAGNSHHPGYLAGYGVIDAELVRELARAATRRLIEEPQPTATQALTYRPTAALARYIRARDLTCRFPGCTVPAERCDIDHTEPFNHHDPAAGGHTVPTNLACYCRQHHLIKTFDTGWHDQQLADATIIWTSPTGATYRTTPAGTDLFGPTHRTRHTDETRRLRTARQRLNTHRDTSTFNRYRNQAAKEEIRLRRWRNQFRGFRVLFHGQTTDTKPSTSPFCTWVNDPIEPEQLPPNWQPPPLPPHNTDPNEPPPF